MNTTLIILVLLLGIILVALEIVALPGGISGLLGLGLLVFGIVQSYLQWGSTIGNIILVGSTLVVVILLAIFMKAKTWKRFVLNEESDSTVNRVDQLNISVGDKGKTVARLAPTGKALFGDKMVEVHAINKFIDPDREIEIVAIEGYRVDVCELEDKRFE